MARTAGIKGSPWVVRIGGFREVSVSDVDELLAEVRGAASPHLFQLFDAGRVAGWEHLYFAAVNAVKAFETGTAVSKSLAIEVLLYASGQDQISQAFATLGLTPATDRVALLVMADGAEEAERAFTRASELLGVADDSVLAVDDEKLEELKRVYSVSDLALGAVGSPGATAITRLLIERGALIPARR
ncbi:MAG: KEOPS complex subunit Cgi121 [Candidatus Bathyarchaeia archaeon]